MSDLIQEDILRWGKKRGYSEAYARYYADHLYCEAHRTYNINVPAVPPHHINSRGAHGNIDESWNLLSLCADCHTMIHTVGDDKFCESFPVMRDQIAAARRRIKYGVKKNGKT